MDVEKITKNVHGSTRDTNLTDGCGWIDEHSTVDGRNHRNVGSSTAKVLTKMGLEEEHIKAHRELLVAM